MTKQSGYNKKGNADRTEDEALEVGTETNGVTNSDDDAVTALAGHLNRTAAFDDEEE